MKFWPMPTAVTALNCVNFKGHLLFARVDICMTKVCAEKNRNFGLKYVEILDHSTHSASAALALSSVWAGGAYTGT